MGCNHSVVVSKWTISDMLVIDETVEFVKFQIKGKSQMMKIHKSVLMENSSFFKDIFTLTKDGDEPMDPILVDDDIGYDLLKAFKLFVDALYGESVNRILKEDVRVDMSNLHQVYHFAEKYAIDWLVKECMKSYKEYLEYVCKKTIVSSLSIQRYAKAIVAMGLDIEQFKDKIKWRNQKDDVVDAFNCATENGFEELKKQVVAFCCYLDFDPSWPQELTDLVIKRLQEVSDKSQLKDGLTQFQLDHFPEDKKHLIVKKQPISDTRIVIADDDDDEPAPGSPLIISFCASLLQLLRDVAIITHGKLS